MSTPDIIQRIEEMLEATAQMSAEEIRAEIVGRVKRWRAKVPLHDDLTFVVMKVN
jgi:serine phosphatase RsbU (regulator of sigma subunit)